MARDARDAGRASAPLAIAPDAVLLDTSALDADAVFEQAVAIVEAVRGDREVPGRTQFRPAASSARLRATRRRGRNGA